MTTRRTEATRRARVEGIRDAAVTCRVLGQAATHRRTPDGQHLVALYDRGAARLQTWTGADLTEVLDRARLREPGEQIAAAPT